MFCWRMLFEAEQNVPKYTVNCCLRAENHAHKVGACTHSKFQDNFLVYNQWDWPLHLYIFLPLLLFVCLFVCFFTFPPCFCLLVTLVSRYPFWQLSINHNMDVPDKDVHYPVRYRLYMPWTPSYNTHRKSLKQKPFLWNFLKNFLHSLFTPLFSLKCALHLPQCWATCILETTVIAKSTLEIRGNAHKCFNISDGHCINTQSFILENIA